MPGKGLCLPRRFWAPITISFPTALSASFPNGKPRRRIGASSNSALWAQMCERAGSRILAFIFAMAALGGAVYMGINGHDWVAGVLGTTTIGMVVTAFVAGKGGNNAKPRQ